MQYCSACRRPLVGRRCVIVNRKSEKGGRYLTVMGKCRHCTNGDQQVTRHRKLLGVDAAFSPEYEAIKFPYRAWAKKIDACKGICPGCKTKADLTIDHVHPFERGGRLIITNLQPLCGLCNIRKGNRVAIKAAKHKVEADEQANQGFSGKGRAQRRQERESQGCKDSRKEGGGCEVEGP